MQDSGRQYGPSGVLCFVILDFLILSFSQSLILPLEQLNHHVLQILLYLKWQLWIPHKSFLASNLSIIKIALTVMALPGWHIWSRNNSRMCRQLLGCQKTWRFYKDSCENDSKEEGCSGQRDTVMRVNRPSWQSIISGGGTFEAYGFLW